MELLKYGETDDGLKWGISKDETATVMGYRGESVKLTIPSEIDGVEVKTISDYAFMQHENITQIILPNSITRIGYNSFAYCSALIGMEIPNSVTSIGEYAFNGCSSMTSVEIPKSVTSIGDCAFRLCYSLTILCEASSAPSGWAMLWNSSDRPVVWNHKIIN